MHEITKKGGILLSPAEKNELKMRPVKQEVRDHENSKIRV